MKIEIHGVEYTEDDVRRDDAAFALAVQDACNLSGVIISMQQAMHNLCEHPRCKGTAWKNHHPVVVLYLSKCVSLSTGDCINSDDYMKADALCEYVVRKASEDVSKK